jgi:hypothetical protein
MYQEKNRMWPSWVWMTIFGVLFVLIIGIYLIPVVKYRILGMDPATGIYGQQDVQEQIETMNFFLTLLGILTTTIGLGFTVFGYLQTFRVPDLVEKDISKIREDIIKTTNKEIEQIDQKLEKGIREMQLQFQNRMEVEFNKITKWIPIFIQHQPAHTALDSIPKLQRLLFVDEIRDLWILDYFRAMETWYNRESSIPTELRQSIAIEQMERHVNEHPDHIDAWLELIFWYYETRNTNKLVDSFQKFLDAHQRFWHVVYSWVRDWPNLDSQLKKTLYKMLLISAVQKDQPLEGIRQIKYEELRKELESL